MSKGSSGSAPYIYVSTRMRVRKAKLIAKDEYMRMLNMGLPEFTRLVEEMEYKREIDELSASFTGVDLIENAVSWNLAKEYQRVLSLAPGELKGFTRDYLQVWDIRNVLTILRGKQLGFSNGKIKAVLVPAGSLDAAALDHMLSEPTIERIVETLPDKTMSGIISEKLSAALEKKSFSEIENDLYKHYYAALLRAGRNGMKDGRPFIQYVRSEIDCVNILNLFRIRAQGAGSASSLDVWIEGGTFTPEELERLVHLALEEAVDSLKKEIKAPALLEALDGLREKKPIYAVGSILTAAQLEQMSRISKRYPFSIAPLMVYLERKRFEVTNLRALARGKEAGLDAETLEMYLVM